MLWNERIKEARLQSGKTLDEVAEKLGVAPSTISRYENEVKRPKYDFLVAMAQIYGVSPAYLAAVSDEKYDGALVSVLYEGMDEARRRRLISYAKYLANEEEEL